MKLKIKRYKNRKLYAWVDGKSIGYISIEEFSDYIKDGAEIVEFTNQDTKPYTVYDLLLETIRRIEKKNGNQTLLVKAIQAGGFSNYIASLSHG